jgi:hypothetical protein
MSGCYHEFLLKAPHRDPKETGDRTLGFMLGVLSRKRFFSLTLTLPKETGRGMLPSVALG